MHENSINNCGLFIMMPFDKTAVEMLHQCDGQLFVDFCSPVGKGVGNHLYKTPFIDPNYFTAQTVYLVGALLDFI